MRYYHTLKLLGTKFWEVVCYSFELRSKLLPYLTRHQTVLWYSVAYLQVCVCRSIVNEPLKSWDKIVGLGYRYFHCAVFTRVHVPSYDILRDAIFLVPPSIHSAAYPLVSWSAFLTSLNIASSVAWEGRAPSPSALPDGLWGNCRRSCFRSLAVGGLIHSLCSVFLCQSSFWLASTCRWYFFLC